MPRGHTEGSEIKTFCVPVQQSLQALKFSGCCQVKKETENNLVLTHLVDLHNEREVVLQWQTEDHFCLTYKENARREQIFSC